MQQISNALTKIIEVIVVALISIMSLLVIVNVGLRFLADSGIVFSEEVSRFLFIWIVFLGSVLAMKEDGHISVDFIRKSFPAPIQKLVIILCYLAMIYCCYLMFLGSYELYEFNMEDLSPVAQIPLGYIYLSGCFGAGGMGIILICKTIAILFTPLAAIKESK